MNIGGVVTLHLLITSLFISFAFIFKFSATYNIILILVIMNETINKETVVKYYEARNIMHVFKDKISKIQIIDFSFFYYLVFYVNTLFFLPTFDFIFITLLISFDFYNLNKNVIINLQWTVRLYPTSQSVYRLVAGKPLDYYARNSFQVIVISLSI